MSTSKAIGMKLRQLRGNRSRAEVASAIGVSVSAIQMYENGTRIPRDQTKFAIADFYGETVGAIFYTREPHETCAKEAVQQ